MIGMAVRNPDPPGVHEILDLLRRQRMVQRPTAEVAGPGQPRVGRQHRLAVLEQQNAGIPESFKSRAHSPNQLCPTNQTPATIAAMPARRDGDSVSWNSIAPNTAV